MHGPDDARESPETSLLDAVPDAVKPPDDPVERDHWARGLRLIGLVAAAAAVIFMWLDARAGWLDYQPGGTAFFTYVRPVFYVLLVLGALAALRWEFVGGVIAGFAAGAIGAIAVNQLVGRHAVLVIVLLAVPASAWLLADLAGWSHRRGVAAIVGTVAAVVAGSFVGEYVYDSQFGPTHPPSELESLPDSALRWVWSGGVTSSEARLRAAADVPFESARLAVTATDDFADATYHPVDDRDGNIVSFTANDLDPDVRHRYAVEIDGELDLVRTGEFTTFPEEAASFSFTVGACARVGSNGSVFDTIRDEDQLFHLITGDFHYGDIPDDDRARYDEVIDLTLRQPAQAALYRSVPIAYVWDDHDYGINDSNFYSESRVAAMDAYRTNVPSYPLAGELSAVFQSFDVGRVRFLITDARSAREPGETMLGESQLAWFLDELVTAAEEQELVVWVNPVPWLAEAEDGADHWGGYADERRRIADVIAEHDIDHLLMVSGDAHMVAIDDGTNTDYSASGDAGFPLLHAAPLDRPGSIKGGPYSEGAIGESGQYGLVEIDDDGETITVALRAKRYDGEVLLRHDFVVGDGDG
ncbi:MAG: alkaline phosphatase D family protein [Ilumatobacteraceae bacterium]|nr:alkaline phosphatase D family protein [Ilumatobacteraceae bacterium]